MKKRYFWMLSLALGCFIATTSLSVKADPPVRYVLFEDWTEYKH
jgi:hypothetical protein